MDTYVIVAIISASSVVTVLIVALIINVDQLTKRVEKLEAAMEIATAALHELSKRLST